MTIPATTSMTPLVALLLAVSTPALATQSGGAPACPIAPDTDFAVYGQTTNGGVAVSSRSWMAHFFDWWQAQDPDVHYQFLSAAEAQHCTDMRTRYPALKMWVQPGGDAYEQQSALAAAGKANINEFIARKGAYLGVCAGAYYASRDYWWEGEFYAHPNLLGAYPRTMEGAIDAIAPWPSYATTALSNGRKAVYFGGPTIGLRHTSPASLAGRSATTFASIAGNLPAVIVYDNLLLTSVHLEAFEGDSVTGLSTEDRAENYKYLANLINSVAHTNFKVPAYADSSH